MCYCKIYPRKLIARYVFTTTNFQALRNSYIEADYILIAMGASASVPPVPGLAESGYLTSTTALELEELPESLIVLGGRYIALELSQMFARLWAPG